MTRSTPQLKIWASRHLRPALTVAWIGSALLATTGCNNAEPDVVGDAGAEPGVVILTAQQMERAGIVARPLQVGAVGVPIEVPGELVVPDTARAVLGSIVEGRVEAVRVVPGDAVRAGDELVLIHSHEMMDARRDLVAAEAELRYAENALARSAQLLQAGAVSREEVERRTADRDAAQADVDRATEMVGHLDPSGDGDVTVRAPRDGVVLAVHVQPSAAVVPGDGLVEVGALRPLWATAHLPEELAAGLQVGAEARVSFLASPADVVEARLVRVGGQVDRLTRTVEVRVEIASPPEGVRPGMFARVELLEAQRRSGMRVPGLAVQQVDGLASVFVDEGEGRYRAVPVDVFPLSDSELLVVGLSEAARVVVEGAPFLKAATEQGGMAEDEG